MSTGETWTLGHRPALDGLRGVAVLLVIATHAGIATATFPSAGAVGVTAFFTLSGFLISRLLLAEWMRDSKLDLRAFFERRARRLLPALGVFLCAMLLLGAGASLLPVMFYVANWEAAQNELSDPLIHMWSLSVEEQFYLAFPFLALLALRVGGRRGLLLLSVATFAFSIAARLYLIRTGASGARIYYGTDTAMAAVAVGCALATARGVALPGRVRDIATLVSVGVLVVIGTGSLGYWVLPAAALVSGVLIFAHLGGAHDGGLLAWSPLRLVGRRSYALYLWHQPVLFLMPLPRPYAILVGVSVAWVLACLSWRYVEEPFLRNKWPSGGPLLVPPTVVAAAARQSS